MMVDYLIVGRGLAANVLAHTLYNRSISFKLIGKENLSNCSRVASGVWNPVVFKRLTASWMANEVVDCLDEFYASCEANMGKSLVTKRSIIKPFVEEQEKVLWRKRADGILKGLIDPVIHENIPDTLSHCHIHSGYGVVQRTGNLNMPLFLDSCTHFFSNSIIDEKFDHDALEIALTSVEYKGVKARKLIFCEGYLVKDNPFFCWIPLKPAKGEAITIKAPALRLKNTIFNKNGFVMDIGEHILRVGATYEWEDLSEKPTLNGLNELKEKLHSMITCNFEVISHEAGIRPSSLDRRPIIGAHPRYKNVYIFNGLGTKGIMLAPFFAKKFVNFSVEGQELMSEVNVERFYNLYVEEKKA